MTWPGFQYSCNLILSRLCSSTWRLSSWWCFDVSGNRKWCFAVNTFSVHNFCLFAAYWVQKKRFNLIHSKLWNIYSFCNWQEGGASASSTHETTFGFSKQLMGACTTKPPWVGLVSDCTLFLFLSMDTRAMYWLYIIMHNCWILSDFSRII